MNKLVKALDRKIVLRASMVDIILGAGIFVLNLFLATIGTSKYIMEGYGNKYGITPQTFPRIIFIAACALSLIMLLEGLKNHKKKDDAETTIQFRLVSFAIFLDMVLFVFLMEPLGYPLANMLMMIIMYWLSNGKSWIKCIITAVIFTVVSVLFFHTYLKLNIPMGLLSVIIH